MDLKVSILQVREDAALERQGTIALSEMTDVVEILGAQTETLHYELKVSQYGHVLMVEGSIEGQLAIACDRCLDPFEWPLQEDFEVTFSPHLTEKEMADDVLLSDEDLDVAFMEGEWLDLLILLGEQVILSLPMKKNCSGDCLGICPQCGSNLNKTACTCHPTDNPDNPFSKFVQGQ